MADLRPQASLSHVEITPIKGSLRQHYVPASSLPVACDETDNEWIDADGDDGDDADYDARDTRVDLDGDVVDDDELDAAMVDEALDGPLDEMDTDSLEDRMDEDGVSPMDDHPPRYNLRECKR